MPSPDHRPLTREEADIIAEEARVQGWESDKRMVAYDKSDGTQGEYNEGRGAIEIHDWDAINRYRREHNNRFHGPLDKATGCSVSLTFPGWQHPEYSVSSTEEWRVLKAKVEELKEIFKQITELGWRVDSTIVKRGRFGMAIKAVYPPGRSIGEGVSVGGMRTWRKVKREAEGIIEQGAPAKTLESGS